MRKFLQRTLRPFAVAIAGGGLVAAGLVPAGAAIAETTSDVPLIAFSGPTGASLVKADGTGLREHWQWAWGYDRAWKPDGTELAYAKPVGFGHQWQIEVMAGDGSTRTIGPAQDGQMSDLTWSPDGQSLLFTLSLDEFGVGQIFSIADEPGAQEVALTPSGGRGSYGGVFNSDGTRIAFVRDAQLWTMSPSGTNVVQHTNMGCVAMYECAEDPDDPATPLTTYCPNTGDDWFCSGGGGLAWDGDSIIFEMYNFSSNDGQDEHYSELGQYVLGSRNVTYRVRQEAVGHGVGDPAISSDGRLAYTLINPDYTKTAIAIEGQGPIALGQDPDWQPCPGGVCPPFLQSGEREATTITLNYSTYPSIRANGQVTPSAAGQKIVVKLSVERGGKWNVIETKKVTLSAMSRYVVKFQKPKQFMCRLTARYPGSTKLLPSVMKKDFSC